MYVNPTTGYNTSVTNGIIYMMYAIPVIVFIKMPGNVVLTKK